MSGETRPAFPHFVETERLILRAPNPADVPQVLAAARETFDDLHAWMEWAETPPELAGLQAVWERARADFDAREDFMVQAHLKSDETLVAVVGFHPRDWRVPKFEIGYWCREGYQGKGYVGETVRALTRIGFEIFGANRIEIRCDARNERSRRVAERCGFRLEGTLPNETVAVGGGLRTTLIFGRIPDEKGPPACAGGPGGKRLD